MPPVKNGPLTLDDIRQIWEGAVDTSYSEPLEQAGEGQGFEAWTQYFAQLARASEACDVNTQALYLLPSSAQSNPPASGARRATVSLAFTRGGATGQQLTYSDRVVVLDAGTTLVDEIATDWGPLPGLGGVQVDTGLQYAMQAAVVFAPGDFGKRELQGRATKPGYGYNDPLPGALRRVAQPGAGYQNTGASVSLTGGIAPRAVLTARNVPDMFLPSQVGQYVSFTTGANAGRIGRIVAYVAPDPVHNLGSGVVLECEQAVAVVPGTGTFAPSPGAPLLFTSAEGLALAYGADTGAGLSLVYRITSGTVQAGDTVQVVNGPDTATVVAVLQAFDWAAEIGTASWQVLDWANDLGIVVTNPLQPRGGKSAMLDMLGGERGVPRAAGEEGDVGDDRYRRRAAQVADVVSPNAIRRVLAKALDGAPYCFREAGDKTYLPGFYFDVDAYDTNCLLFAPVGTPTIIPAGIPLEWRNAAGSFVGRGVSGGQDPHGHQILVLGMRNPSRLAVVAGDVLVSPAGAVYPVSSLVDPTCRNGLRWHTWLDYEDMRAFFLVGLPPGNAGEFGFYWGDTTAHVGGFYDQTLEPSNFYDGFPRDFYAAARAVWQDVERVRAGGVEWTMYIERVGCP